MDLLIKKCTACLEKLDVEAFSKNKAQKDGLHSQCKACNSEHYRANKAKISERRIAYYYDNQTKSQQYSRDWYEANKERHGAVAKNWSAGNRGKSNAIKQKYKAAKKRAAPPWLTEWDIFVMEEYYHKADRLRQLTGKEYHVDHIHPLQGKTLCGLHVPWNLQILPARVNIQKSNKVDLVIYDL